MQKCGYFEFLGSSAESVGSFEPYRLWKCSDLTNKSSRCSSSAPFVGRPDGCEQPTTGSDESSFPERVNKTQTGMHSVGP